MATEEKAKTPQSSVATEEDEIVEIVEVVEDFSAKNEGPDPSMEEEETEVPETSVATEENDVVVAEYDVYFNPPDPSSPLYVLQYPLRPLWRPYDLERRCTEVRFKQDTGEVEVDLAIDTNSDNFDVRSNDQFKMNKQVLSSSCSLPQTTGYAIGVLVGKKLFVNPVHAVLQLRPSMEYLDSGGSQKRNNPDVTVKEGPNNDVRSRQSSKQKKQVDPEASEPWVSLKYHSSTSELSKRYLKKMMTTQDNPLQFSMNPREYLDSLCPKAAITKMQSSRPSRRFLLTLPLEERIKTLLIEGPSVQRFAAITHLAPNDPVEDVLEELQKYAMLVQGLWVVKTRVRYPNTKGSELLARDYALLLFSKSPVFKDSELDFLGSFKSTEKVLVVLGEIAVERPYCKDWKFIEPTDVSFIKHYPDVVEQQQKAWQGHEPHLQQIVDERRARAGARIGANSKTSGRPGLSMLPVPDESKETHQVCRPPLEQRRALLEELRTKALTNALTNIFHDRQVCRFLLTLPLEERIKTLLIEGPSVQRFAAITHLAPNDPVEDVLEELQKYAMLVQGLWVVKTRVRYPNTKGSELLARDYALLLFSKSPVFKDSELDFLGSFKSTEKVLVVLGEIAVERPYCKDWKFIEPTDVSFIKHYPDVVEQQQKAWQGHEPHLQQIVDERRARAGARIGANSKTSGRPGLSMLPVPDESKETHQVCRPPLEQRRALLEELRTKALTNALTNIFHDRQVCSFQRIVQILRDTDVVAATVIHEENIKSIISDIAVDIHGVYVLKSSPRHPELDPLRKHVIDLFRIREPNAKLLRSYFNGAVTNGLEVMPTETDLRKVLEECCVSSGNKWVLKSG